MNFVTNNLNNNLIHVLLIYVPNSSNLSRVLVKVDFILSWSLLAFRHSSPAKEKQQQQLSVKKEVK